MIQSERDAVSQFKPEANLTGPFLSDWFHDEYVTHVMFNQWPTGSPYIHLLIVHKAKDPWQQWRRTVYHAPAGRRESDTPSGHVMETFAHVAKKKFPRAS